jgi:hypothetical protein
MPIPIVRVFTLPIVGTYWVWVNCHPYTEHCNFGEEIILFHLLSVEK